MIVRVVVCYGIEAGFLRRKSADIRGDVKGRCAVAKELNYREVQIVRHKFISDGPK